jgi:mono/diheme cytochrome c family protein
MANTPRQLALLSFLLVQLALAWWVAPCPLVAAEQAGQIQPLFARYCFACHGEEKRSTRLIFSDAENGNGYPRSSVEIALQLIQAAAGR